MAFTLNRKITFVFSAGLIVVTLILVTTFSNEVNNRYKELLFERGINAADQLAFKTEKLFSLGLYPEEFNGFEMVLLQIFDSTEGLYSIALTDINGKIWFRILKGEAGAHSINNFADNLYSAPNDNRLVVKKIVDGSFSQHAVVEIELDQSFITANTLVFARTTLLYSGLISIFAVLGILYYLRFNLGYPLQRLVKQIQNVDLDNNNMLDVELATRNDEIGIVASSFSELIERLSFQRQSLAKTNAELLCLTEELEFRVSTRTQELEEANERLESMAHVDFLTGLLNRHSLKDILDYRFQQALKHKHNFSVLMLDLDEFKSINDIYGHTAGDVVLGVVGQRMRNSLQHNDNIFRYGGDEFIFIVENYPDSETLISMVINIHDVISKPISYEGKSLNFGVSIGVARSESLGSANAEMLIQLADKAMYQAKRNKLGYVICKADESQNILDSKFK